MSSCLKEGLLKKWSKSKKTYKTVYAKLLCSGWFQWFDHQGSVSPKRSIDVKIVSAYLAFGSVINQVPSKPPNMTDEEIERSFIVPHEPHKSTKIALFMCSNPAELGTWIDAINKLLYGGDPCQGPVGSDFITPQQAPQTVESGSYGYPPGGASYPGVPPTGVSYPGLPQPGYPDVSSYPGDPYGGGGYPPTQPAAYPPPPPAFHQSAPQPYSGAIYPTAPGGSYPPPPPQGGGYSQPQVGGFSAPPSGYPSGSRFTPPAPGGYPSAAVGGGYGAPMAGGYGAPMGAAGYQQQPYMVDKKGKPYTVIYKNGKPKKKKWKNAALGLAAGIGGGYLAGNLLGGLGRMGMGGYGGGWGGHGFGGGWGGHGLGRGWGSWSSLSSWSS